MKRIFTSLFLVLSGTILIAQVIEYIFTLNTESKVQNPKISLKSLNIKRSASPFSTSNLYTHLLANRIYSLSDV
ncbi:MAG: hypothetical protein WD052_02425, partial [Bacteroidales bacterium]